MPERGAGNAGVSVDLDQLPVGAAGDKFFVVLLLQLKGADLTDTSG